MVANPKSIRGWMKNGVIVPEPGSDIPDGSEVRLMVVAENAHGPVAFTPEEQAEFEGWDRLGDQAWAMIDEWEREEVDGSR